MTFRTIAGAAVDCRRYTDDAIAAAASVHGGSGRMSPGASKAVASGLGIADGRRSFERSGSGRASQSTVVLLQGRGDLVDGVVTEDLEEVTDLCI